MQALVADSSEATDTGGFVSLSAVANKMFVVLVSGDDVREEGLPCISQCQITNLKSLFVDLIMNLEICFSPPTFSFLTFSFFSSYQHGISPGRFCLIRDKLHLSGRWHP